MSNPITVELPDGRVLEFPEGTPESVITQMAAKYYAEPKVRTAEQVKAEQAAKPSTTDRLLRSAGLGTRNLVEGVVGGLTALPSYLGNLASGVTTGNYERFGNPGEGIADALGLPKPDGEEERLMHDVVTGGLEMGAPGGLVGMAGKAGKAVTKAAPALSRFLFEAPGMQAASGAAAAGASSFVNPDGDNAAGGAAAGVLGGLLPAILHPVGRAALNVAGGTLGDVRDVASAFTEGGRKRIAGRVLRDAAGDMDAERVARMPDAEMAALIEGSDPTLAQASGNSGLAALEKVAESRGLASGRFAERLQAQRDAQQALANEVGDAASARLDADRRGIDAAVPMGIDELEAGQILRKSFDDAYAAQKKVVHDAYESVDPNGESRFRLDPIVDSFDEMLGQGELERAAVPAEVSKYMAKMREMSDNGQMATWRDLQSMRSEFSDMAYKAQTSGDRKTARIAGMLKTHLDDYVETLSNDENLVGSHIYPTEDSKAAKQAWKEASRLVQDNELSSEFAWISHLGLDRKAAERLLSKEEVRDMSRRFPGMFRNNGVPITSLSDSMLSNLGVERIGEGSMDEGAVMQHLADMVLGGDMRRRSQVSQLANDLLSSGSDWQTHTGFTPEQADALRNARLQRTIQGQRFESGANADLALAGNSIGGRRVDDSSIPGRYFRPGPGGSESMEAFRLAHGGGTDAAYALRGHAERQARNASMGKDGFDPAKSAAWRMKNEAALASLPSLSAKLQALEGAANGLAERRRSLAATLRKTGDNWGIRRGARIDDRFGSSGNGVYTDQELDRLAALQKDSERIARTQRLGAVSGSPTARNLSGAAQVENAVTPFLGKIPGVSSALERLFKSVNDKTWREVQDGLLSPQYGASLMRQAAPSRVSLADGLGLARAGRDIARGVVGGGLLSEMEGRNRKRRKK